VCRSRTGYAEAFHARKIVVVPETSMNRTARSVSVSPR
jgi:hypothetical protein